MGPGTPRRILLVDDEADILDTVKQLLAYKLPDIEVTTVASGKAALAVLEKSRVDLVITDFRMPAMDGAELVVRIRKQWPTTPILMLTAYLEPATLTDLAHRVPELDILPKPLELDHFIQAVERLLGPAQSS